MQKANQRSVTFTRASFARAVDQILAREFRLGADKAVNDVWLTLDFSDPEFERAVARYIYRMLGERYSRLRCSPVDEHC